MPSSRSLLPPVPALRVSTRLLDAAAAAAAAAADSADDSNDDVWLVSIVNL